MGFPLLSRDHFPGHFLSSWYDRQGSRPYINMILSVEVWFNRCLTCLKIMTNWSQNNANKPADKHFTLNQEHQCTELSDWLHFTSKSQPTLKAVSQTGRRLRSVTPSDNKHPNLMIRFCDERFPSYTTEKGQSHNLRYFTQWRRRPFFFLFFFLISRCAFFFFLL